METNPVHEPRRVLFAIGDYVAGAITGAATAAVVRAVVSPDLDMVLAMLIGMGVGMIVHFAVGIVFSPILGLFHFMVPAGLIGMYGGMLFAMRDTMQHHPGSLGRAILVGVVFGAAMAAGIRLYDRVLHAKAAPDSAG